VLVAGLAGLAAASYDPIDDSIEGLKKKFLELKAEEDADFDSPTLGNSEKETNMRFGLLQKCAKKVKKHNAENDDFEEELNKFSIMTVEEKASYTGLKPNQTELLKREYHELTFMSKRSLLSLHARQAANVDYSDDLPAVKNQGSCGSCWTFGAAAALEYQLNRNRGSLSKKVISEEQLLDCTYPTRNGCQGGWPVACYEWIQKAGTDKPANYIASMKDYPYQGVDGDCETGAKNHIAGFQLGTTKYVEGEPAVYAAVGNKDIGVLSVAIAVVEDFYSYKSGVYSGEKCGDARINHAVDIVGYGVENGKNYYRVRNSWGSNWGAGGYLKMKRGESGNGICQLAKYSHYPVVSGSSEDKDEGDDNDGDDNDDGDNEEEAAVCGWMMIGLQKFKGKVQGCTTWESKEDTIAKCLELKKDCKGITCHKKKGCKCVKKARGKEHEKYISYKHVCCESGLTFCDNECKHEHTCGKEAF